MTWVKRGGGSGTGLYDGGLPPAGTEAEPQSQRRPKPQATDTAPEPSTAKDAGPSPAYRVTTLREAIGNRVILDVLAGMVHAGGNPELSMLYEDALEAFGTDSMHFQAACTGRLGVGAHYQRTIAGGQFWEGR